MDIKKEIAEITALAYEANDTTYSDVFLSYSGHVDMLDGYVFIDGWREGAKGDWSFKIRLKKYKCEEVEEFEKNLETEIEMVKFYLLMLMEAKEYGRVQRV